MMMFLKHLCRMSKSFFSVVVLLLHIFSCSKSNRQDVLARYKNETLHLSDVIHFMPDGLRGEDSIYFVKNYVRHWIEQQIIIDDARHRWGISERDIHDLLNEYRKALFRQQWEQRVTEAYSNNEVTEDEIKQYYHQNRHEFILSDDVMRLLYARFHVHFEHVAAVRELFQAPEPDNVEIDRMCRQYAVNWFTQKDVWLYLTDVAKEIPIKEADRQVMLQGKTFFQFQTDDYIYFLRVLELKPSGSVAPLSFVEDKITRYLLHRKRKEILQSEINRLVEQAQKKGFVKTFIE